MIRVLVVDDSAFMRNMITKFLTSNHEIAVAGTARNGEATMNMQEPLQFSIFPSLLLLLTLFRLGLNVSTTRSILSNGDAGKVVETFGSFVVFIRKLSHELQRCVGIHHGNRAGNVRF